MSIIPRARTHFGRRYEPPPRVQIWDHPSADPVLTSTRMSFPITEASAQIEWTESPEAHVLRAHLAGLRPEEVRVEVEEEERVVCITGERKVAREETKGTWHHIERSSGRFVQRVRLPENARMKQVKAYMDNGVLTVTVPKYEVANYHHGRPRIINISGH